MPKRNILQYTLIAAFAVTLLGACDGQQVLQVASVDDLTDSTMRSANEETTTVDTILAGSEGDSVSDTDEDPIEDADTLGESEGDSGGGDPLDGEPEVTFPTDATPATDTEIPDSSTSDTGSTDPADTDSPFEPTPDTADTDTNESEEPTVVQNDWWQPKASDNLTWQWQLQGEIDTTVPAQVYNIDIEAPADKIAELKSQDVKLICYFSAGTIEYFRSDFRDFPQEIIGEQYEDLVDERWVDYANIDALAPIMRARLDKCKDKGFDAIEIDNVDAHNYESRDENGNVINIGTNFKMSLEESTAYVLWLAREAHSRGLSIGLKNAEEMVYDVVGEVDWMLVEDCYYDSWCEYATPFIDADKPVFMAEYDDLVPDFTPACELAKTLGFFAIWRDSSLATELYLACE